MLESDTAPISNTFLQNRTVRILIYLETSALLGAEKFRDLCMKLHILLNTL